MSYAMEQEPPNIPNDESKRGRGRPKLQYSMFLKSLYKDADQKRLASLNVYRCEWKKKEMEDIQREIDRHKKEIKHLEYIVYEKKMVEYAKMKPPTV